MVKERKGLIFDIKRDSSEDGPGIRTTVFFKGCMLACSWCQNPEGLGTGPGMAFRKQQCIAPECGVPCANVCQEQVFHFNPPSLQVNHSLCSGCRQCLDVCPTHALEPVGFWLRVDELYHRVMVDRPFFNATGGGVTVSGGEATMQMAFVHEFLKKLKEDHIHTAIETNGVFNLNRFKRLLLPYLDLIYFDIKLIDEAASIKHTGLSNRPVLKNFIHLLKNASIPVITRIPLVPGITATEDNLTRIAAFLRANKAEHAELLPYNPLWQDKTERLGVLPRYQRRSFMTPPEVEACLACFKKGRVTGNTVQTSHQEVSHGH